MMEANQQKRAPMPCSNSYIPRTGLALDPVDTGEKTLFFISFQQTRKEKTGAYVMREVSTGYATIRNGYISELQRPITVRLDVGKEYLGPVVDTTSRIKLKHADKYLSFQYQDLVDKAPIPVGHVERLDMVRKSFPKLSSMFSSNPIDIDSAFTLVTLTLPTLCPPYDSSSWVRRFYDIIAATLNRNGKS